MNYKNRFSCITDLGAIMHSSLKPTRQCGEADKNWGDEMQGTIAVTGQDAWPDFGEI